MKLLAVIRPEDADKDAPVFDYAKFKHRPAGRAIIFDDDKLVLAENGKEYSDEEIISQTHFYQERWFTSVIVR